MELTTAAPEELQGIRDSLNLIHHPREPQEITPDNGEIYLDLVETPYAMVTVTENTYIALNSYPPGEYFLLVQQDTIGGHRIDTSPSVVLYGTYDDRPDAKTLFRIVIMGDQGFGPIARFYRDPLDKDFLPEPMDLNMRKDPNNLAKFDLRYSSYAFYGSSNGAATIRVTGAVLGTHYLEILQEPMASNTITVEYEDGALVSGQQNTSAGSTNLYVIHVVGTKDNKTKMFVHIHEGYNYSNPTGGSTGDDNPFS